MKTYEITEDHVNGFQVIRITVGKFQNVRYTYGSVAFESLDGEEIILQFEYNLIDGADKVEHYENEFKSLTGDILVHILEDQISTASVIYKGGTD